LNGGHGLVLFGLHAEITWLPEADVQAMLISATGTGHVWPMWRRF
jgi:hypothetical protein